MSRCWRRATSAAATSGATRPSCGPTTSCRGTASSIQHSLKLWEGLEADLNYNVMHSQRGLINLFHSDGQRDAFVRRGNAMINQGDDAILWTATGCANICPIWISTTPGSRSMAACCIRAAGHGAA
jgi:glycine/D-amino acid oxidase-like deaminating enzyme